MLSVLMQVVELRCRDKSNLTRASRRTIERPSEVPQLRRSRVLTIVFALILCQKYANGISNILSPAPRGFTSQMAAPSTYPYPPPASKYPTNNPLRSPSYQLATASKLTTPFTTRHASTPAVLSSPAPKHPRIPSLRSVRVPSVLGLFSPR